MTEKIISTSMKKTFGVETKPTGGPKAGADKTLPPEISPGADLFEEVSKNTKLKIILG